MTHLIPCALVVLLLAAPGSAGAEAPRPSAAPPNALAPHPGEQRRAVSLAPSERSGATGDDADRLASRLVALHLAWIAGDPAAYGALLTRGVTRLSEETGTILRGKDAVLGALAAERDAFEHPRGPLELTMALERVQLSISGDHAIAIYDVEVAGQGRSRWEFDDQWSFFQAFERGPDGGWLLSYQADASDLGQVARGRRPLDFDFAYPVRDLSRAVRFYSALLGPPETIGTDRATFALGAPRFVLDATELGGLARVRPRLPNGYAIIYVADLEAECTELAKRGVAFATDMRQVGRDQERVALDPSGNVFVLRERRYAADATTAPTLEAPPHTPELVTALTNRWLAADAAGIDRASAKSVIWFDNTRSGVTTTARLSAEERAQRLAADFAGYDRGPAGLSAKATLSQVTQAAFGPWTLVSYHRRLSSDGSHPFREDALVTHLIDGGRLSATFISRATAPRAVAYGLDYTGYPVVDLRAAKRFYQQTMRFGAPYADEDYFGFWSAHSVFGIYTSDPDDDRVPVRGAANGYVCFCVDSAKRAYEFLAAHGSEFPIIESITSQSGVDVQPGYIQVLATDSEGNALIVDEYTGR